MARRCLRCLFFRLRFLELVVRRNLFPRGGGIMWMGIMIFVLLRSKRKRRRRRREAVCGVLFSLVLFLFWGEEGGRELTQLRIGMDGRGDMNE